MSSPKICLCVLLFWGNVYSQKNSTTNDKCLQITHLWLKESIDLTKNCVGFSAPVAARSFAYLSISLYECGLESHTNHVSLSGQLDGYNRSTWKKENETLFWPHVYNYFTSKIIKQLYANMPPSNLTKVEFLEDSIFRTYKKKLTKKLKDQSEDYANRLFEEIKNWSAQDGGNEGYNKNFPKTYKAPICSSCWTVTVPGYLNALQPYWGNNRLLVSENNNIYKTIIPPTFSIDTNSSFYRDAFGIYSNNLSRNPNIELIAEYWDDAPGYSGTPTGHLFCLGIQLVKQYHFDLPKALHFYALLGIAINDAFIVCWKEKYNHNLLRPITYIQRYISPDFNTFIPTPPFPEFPSGHSFQSGAGIEVFKLFFSDTLSFIDSTNINRRDIAGKPREFKNFTSLANEISLSRYYGGIHFMNTLNLSLGYGKLLGQNTIHQLNFIK